MVAVGGPARGLDFIGRENEIKLIHEKMEKDNLILVAPRRFGKTSIMLKITDNLIKNDKIAIFLEVENVHTPSEFITEMIVSLIALQNKTKRQYFISLFEKTAFLIKEHFTEIETPIFKTKFRDEVHNELNKDWQNVAKKLINTLGASEETVYFVIDEFPIAIQNIKNRDENEAKKLLQWFRNLRQKSLNVKFLIGGSVSIDNIVRDVGGIALINDFDRIRIGGFDKDVALKVSEKIIGENYTPKIGEKILECIGEPYIPYFLMIILTQINDEQALNGKSITEDDIEILYNKKILGSHGKHYFQHYYDRLREDCNYSNMGEKAAKAILGKVCLTDYYDIEMSFDIYKNETGNNDRSKFNDLIANLENDFYLERDDQINGLKFYSKMLSDWWRKYYASNI